MKCPYSEYDMNIAAISLSSKEDLLASLEESNICQDWVESQKKYLDKAELNRGVAEANGISLETLINSPNYQLLIDEFKAKALYDLVARIETQGFTNQEAWAVIMAGMEN